MITKTQIIKAVYQSENWNLTSKERQMLTTTEMRCLRKAAGKTRMDNTRNEEIRRRVNMQPAEQTANKSKIRWWSHIKRRAPTAPQSKALVIQQTANKNKTRWWSHIKRREPTAPQSKALVVQPEGRRPRGRPRNRWEDDTPRWYNEMSITMTDVNN